MRVEKPEVLPFSHFIGNTAVINQLKLELLMLKGRRYTCNNESLPYIEEEIRNIERCIKFNENL